MQGEEVSTSILVVIAGILIVGVAIAKAAEKYRVPHPIPLVFTGLLLGRIVVMMDPAIGLIEFTGFDFIAQLTLATVLFYAGLTLNLRELRLSLVNVMLLATAGVIATSLIGGFAIAAALQLGIAAFLIGAILSPTDPAALFSVLEAGGVRVKRKLFSILEGEAVFNDATSVILVITVFVPFVIGSHLPDAAITNWWLIIAEFSASMGLGVILGFVVANITGRAILRAEEDTSVSILTVTTPFLAYGLGELISLTTGFEIHPGALAAVFAGIFMANARRIGMQPLPQRSMRGVMKNASFFFEIVVFILLGYTLSVPLIAGHPETETISFLVANPGVVQLGLITSILVILVARPISVFLVTSVDRKMGFKERIFLSWAGVKGVASAALAAISVSAIIHEASTLPAGPTKDAYINSILTVIPSVYAIVFIVLTVSLVVQGLSTSWLAGKLNLVEGQDRAKEITVHRDATRQALLRLVDLYTESQIDPDIYSLLKSELEEEIFRLEDELRRVVSERRARLQELRTREEIFKAKLEFYRRQFEEGRIGEGTYQEIRSELEAQIEEILNRIKHQMEGLQSD